MFDDPKKDLKWLEQQLLAEERSKDDPEEAEDDWLEPGQTRTFRNQPEDIFRFLEEDMEEVPAPRRTAGKRRKKRKEKSLGKLVFLACVETLGIVALLIWWLLWMQ